ncbi:hypothetical protein TRFO_38872 [Tritrichomonas foetus]|uniref:Uncharacterized protein n=1 Tax=Tritrichomonas foetus TaxID=1144522 RepID=A0A1J4JCF2_9EUKA|nr:hypothetical protein TRFO_38872 [Tritrichomonas foetus]|eukprot:OHS94948.1 hypothetical protein TRFO_38872 [Tritrichomonas foetus]
MNIKLTYSGTLAGCYLIKNYGFSAPEAIGWIRICRPGSVIGPQQQFLLDFEAEIHRSYYSYFDYQPQSTNQHNHNNRIHYHYHHSNNNNLNSYDNSIQSNNQQMRLKTSNKPRISKPNHFEPRSAVGTSNKKKRNIRLRTAVPPTPDEYSCNFYKNDEHFRNDEMNFNEKSQNHHNLLNIKAVGITPTVPQPRKIKRAMAAPRRTPRKL